MLPRAYFDEGTYRTLYYIQKVTPLSDNSWINSRTKSRTVQRVLSQTTLGQSL